MARMIDADALLHDNVWLCGGFVGDPYSDGYMDALDNVEAVIREFPIVDAVEVVYGRWVDRYGGKYANPVYDCSKCGKTAPRRNTMDTFGNWLSEQYFANYCPNCGAKMDGDGNG